LFSQKATTEPEQLKIQNSEFKITLDLRLSA
jgi:hypothetical protein